MSPACRGTPPRRLYVAAGVPIYVAEKRDDVLLLGARMVGVDDRPRDHRDGGLTVYVFRFTATEERVYRWVRVAVVALSVLTIAGLLAATW